MDEAMTDFARRLVASHRWRWMPGMRATRPGPWTEPDAVRVPESLPNGGYPGWLPDLTDPATLGCLLAMVGEAWGSDHDVSRFATHTERGVEIWHRLERMDLNGWSSLVTVPVTVGETRFIGGATLAAALVDALLHAPVPS